MNDDEKKDDIMESLQTRLITEDTLSNASLVQHDVDHDPEGQQQQDERIVVMDQVTRGEKQPNQFRDAPFAILFLVHLIVISFFAFVWGIPAMVSASKNDSNNDNDNNTIENDVKIGGLLGLCFLSTLAGMMILLGTLHFMIKHADILIQLSLMLSIGFSLVFAVGFAVGGMIWFSIIYVLLALMGIWYTFVVWRRIPFAKSNLVTATTAIQQNFGIVGVAIIGVGVSVVWSFLWMLSYGGIYMHSLKCQDGDGSSSQETCDEGTLGQIVGIIYLFSFYWTSEVIKNILVVTVSGVVGTWWFAPHEANSFWSNAIVDSLSRATSYSLGSICFGSLLMALIQVVHQLIHEARRHGRGNDLLLCILECLVACLESVAEYFNKFAFIYTGLYGYDYLTAGKKVMDLFSQRGWSVIINDQLVYRVLNLLTLLVAGLTGCVGMLVAYLIPSWVESLEDARYVVAFLLPFLIGAALAHVVLGVVASATDTVIVCFAESPNEFRANYPRLSSDMMSAWQQIYPNVGL